MRRLALVALIGTLIAGVSARAQSQDAASVTTLADEVLAAITQRFPENATDQGLAGAPHHRAFDNSPEAERAWEARVDGFLKMLRSIDRRALAGRPEAVTLGFLQQYLESRVQRRACRSELWGVDQQNGWQVRVPAILRTQPVATDADRKAALERLRQYPRFIDQEIATLRTGLSSGYSSPRDNVDRVIGQVEGLMAGEPAASPFAAATSRSEDAAFKQSVAEIVAKEINPALGRYRSFLGEYRTVARTNPGVSEIPNGEACYRALVRDYTTLDLTPDDLHALGLRIMEDVHAEMRTLGARHMGTPDIAGILGRLRGDPGLRYRSADEILAVARASLARARAAIPKFFGRLPKTDVVIEPFAAFEAPSMPPAQYRLPPLDGSRPGRYMVNLHQPEQTPRYDTEAIAFHEAIPGHHLQVALTIEQTGMHPLTQMLWATAFVEGWGLYTERLADEMGLYSSDLDRLGMLSAAAWRAARLVVDTGLHSKKWTRQQAVDYMRQNTAVGEQTIQTEIDRYIIYPGQALAYMVGQREITSLREKAQAALGARFDIRAFHDVVLERGGVTLPMLREQVEAWIAVQNKIGGA